MRVDQEHLASVPEHRSRSAHPEQVTGDRPGDLTGGEIGRRLDHPNLVDEVRYDVHGLVVENDAVSEHHVVTAEVYLGGVSGGRVDAVLETQKKGVDSERRWSLC